MGGTLHLRYGPEARDLARRKSPTSRIVADEQVVFEDPEVQVVGLFTLADSRLRQIKKAMAFGKHVISEKPVADTIEHEWEVVKCVENSSLFSTVNCICVILGTIIRLRIYPERRDRRFGDHSHLPYDSGVGSG